MASTAVSNAGTAVSGQITSRLSAACAVIVNDYSVLAGTQGFYHHMKLDRIIGVAADKQLPVVMYTEGGGGRGQSEEDRCQQRGDQQRRGPMPATGHASSNASRGPEVPSHS